MSGIISENSTRLQKSVDYDRKTNQLIGLVAPLYPETGLPFQDYFEALSSSKIVEFMENYEKADQLTVLMFKPYFQGKFSYLKFKVILNLFLLQEVHHDNRYCTNNIDTRWSYA